MTSIDLQGHFSTFSLKISVVYLSGFGPGDLTQAFNDLWKSCQAL